MVIHSGNPGSPVACSLSTADEGPANPLFERVLRVNVEMNPFLVDDLKDRKFAGSMHPLGLAVGNSTQEEASVKAQTALFEALQLISPCRILTSAAVRTSGELRCFHGTRPYLPTFLSRVRVHSLPQPEGIVENGVWDIIEMRPAKTQIGFTFSTHFGCPPHAECWHAYTREERQHKLEAEAFLNARPLNGRSVSQERDTRPARADEAIRALEFAEKFHGLVLDPDRELQRLRTQVSNQVTIISAPGRPAEALVVVGANASLRSKFPTAAFPNGVSSSVPIETALSDIAELDEADGVAVDPQVLDVIRMERAAARSDTTYPGLRENQQEMVRLHTATSQGVVNAMPTGTGKTVTTYVGMSKRAANIPKYRALVAVEAVVRRQWADEAATWFPDAEVAVVTTAKQFNEINVKLDQTEKPVVVVVSYALIAAVADATLPDQATSTAQLESVPPLSEQSFVQLKMFEGHEQTPELDAAAPQLSSEATWKPESLAELLGSTHWHDLVVDEATVLANNVSTTSKALWRIRQTADVALALTATPADKNLDDLGRMVAFVRNRKSMFRGNRLDKYFDELPPLEAADLVSSALGPTVYRTDKTTEEIPESVTTVIDLEPTAEERVLADAACNQLRQAYEELVRCVEQMAATEEAGQNSSGVDLEAVRESLQEARGAWLSGTTLALMACADPETLLQSESAGAMLLASQGLITSALNGKPTKRNWLTETLVERCGNGDRAIVFTQFSSVAENLIASLAEAGLKVGGIIGGGGAKRDQTVTDFQGGRLDVVVATKAGEKGLNLQRANVLVHYDLPWTPKSLLQRNGRFERIGSEHEAVEVLVPLMQNTLEVRVANIVASRATKAMLTLDRRGRDDVDLSETTTGKAFKSLMNVKSAGELKSGDASMLEVGAALLA